ncbi:hypothetical protein GCM10009828_038630 [Actinoplanes couchii]|uniref:Uncharacterized protein n=1 Tax=Actinoplanes couchii TaxID=403638 RepID=A0ABQ3XG88_9ACTN|nr:hypothetical protein Aco03nite_058390 [Actinoplanes couchii]
MDRVDVREEEDDLTLILGASGVHVMQIRVRYDGWTDEVINPAGEVAPGPGSFTLIGRELTLEFGAPSARTLGFPRDYRLHLDVDDAAISRARAALLEILDCACYVIDTPEGRITS